MYRLYVWLSFEVTSFKHALVQQGQAEDLFVVHDNIKTPLSPQYREIDNMTTSLLKNTINSDITAIMWLQLSNGNWQQEKVQVKYRDIDQKEGCML